MSDPMQEAIKNLSAEAAEAIDLYVLEQGPLTFDAVDGGTYTFTVRQNVRLRLKEAEEIRADERERIVQRVEALNDPWPTSAPGTLPREWVIAAIKGEQA